MGNINSSGIVDSYQFMVGNGIIGMRGEGFLI